MSLSFEIKHFKHCEINLKAHRFARYLCGSGTCSEFLIKTQFV